MWKIVEKSHAFLASSLEGELSKTKLTLFLFQVIQFSSKNFPNVLPLFKLLQYSHTSFIYGWTEYEWDETFSFSSMNYSLPPQVLHPPPKKSWEQNWPGSLTLPVICKTVLLLKLSKIPPLILQKDSFSS